MGLDIVTGIHVVAMVHHHFEGVVSVAVRMRLWVVYNKSSSLLMLKPSITDRIH